MFSHNSPNRNSKLWTLHLALLAALLAALFYGAGKHDLVQAQEAKTQGAAVTKKFDGYKLYHAAVDAYLKHARSLRGKQASDRQKRDKWYAEWYGKHDSDGMLDTADGAAKAIREMQASLGERFEFLYTPQETQAEKEAETSIIYGIGVTLTIKGSPGNGCVSGNCPLLLESVDQGSPAETAGLKIGDRLVTIDDQPTDGMTLRQALEKLRGDQNSRVTVTYQRNDAQGQMHIASLNIPRAPVKLKVVTAAGLGEGITHLKLRSFDSDQCDDQMAEALKSAAGSKALIIDLRYNRGGWVYQAMNIGQQFLPEGTLYIRRGYDGEDLYEIRFAVGDDYLARQSYLNGKPQFPLKITDRVALEVAPGTPVVVLVNQYTASAAEVLAGILQYQLQATVVGTTTRGKGVGQTSVSLPYGWSLHITSFDFRPAGIDLDLVGIIPDIKVDQPDDSANDLQLEAARQAALDLIRKRESLEQERQDLKRKRQDDFEKSRREPAQP